MTIRCSVFIATSLDGFISRLDGSIDWLLDADRLIPEGEDCGYATFIETIDRIVMGRNSFDQVQTFDSWPYGIMPMTVLTSRPMDIPEALQATVTCSSQPPEVLLAELERQGHRHIYVDGGVTIQRFMAAGLIDDLVVTTIPVLLGARRPLFGILPADVNLRLVSSRSWDFGFVQSSYQVL